MIYKMTYLGGNFGLDLKGTEKRSVMLQLLSLVVLMKNKGFSELHAGNQPGVLEKTQKWTQSQRTWQTVAWPEQTGQSERWKCC